MIVQQMHECGYELQVLESLSDVQAIVPEWQEFLAEGIQGSNYFNDPIKILAQLELEPQLAPWIVVLRRDGRICCIAPFILHTTRLKIEISVIKLGSLPVRMLRLFGGQFVVALDIDAARCYQSAFDCVWSQ